MSEHERTDPPRAFAVEVRGTDWEETEDAFPFAYRDAVEWVNGVADEWEADGFAVDRSWASRDNLYAVRAARGDAVRTAGVVRVDGGEA